MVLTEDKENLSRLVTCAGYFSFFSLLVKIIKYRSASAYMYFYLRWLRVKDLVKIRLKSF